MHSSSSKPSSNDSTERPKVPRWLPITLLAVTTAALTVPAVLLWRQKHALGRNARISFLVKQSDSAPPARRRPLSTASFAQTGVRAGPSTYSTTTTSASNSPVPPPPRRSGARSNVVITNTTSSLSVQKSVSPAQPNQESVLASLLNGPLLSLGALGLATAAVGVGATLGIWGIQRSLGVNNVDEFAARARQLIQVYMPSLSRRLYHSPKEASDERHSNDGDGEASKHQRGGYLTEWTWDSAEKRLQEAFDRGGAGEWAVCAIRELEAEEQAERRRRGL